MSSTSTNCRPSKSSRPMFDGLESEGLVDPKALPESCPSLKSSLRAQLDEAIAGPLRSALGVPHTAQPPHLAQALWLVQMGARFSKFSSILWPSQHRDMVGPCTCFEFRGQGVPNGGTPCAWVAPSARTVYVRTSRAVVEIHCGCNIHQSSSDHRENGWKIFAVMHHQGVDHDDSKSAGLASLFLVNGTAVPRVAIGFVWRRQVPLLTQVPRPQLQHRRRQCQTAQQMPMLARRPWLHGATSGNGTRRAA